MADVKSIIVHLAELELLDENTITEEIIRSQFRKLTKVYHPDVAPQAFKDGKKFRKIKEANDYLVSHIDDANIYLHNGSMRAGSNQPQQEANYSRRTEYSYESSQNSNASSEGKYKSDSYQSYSSAENTNYTHKNQYSYANESSQSSDSDEEESQDNYSESNESYAYYSSSSSSSSYSKPEKGVKYSAFDIVCAVLLVAAIIFMVGAMVVGFSKRANGDSSAGKLFPALMLCFFIYVCVKGLVIIFKN